MHLETEALLMFAARREHLAQVIEPALARGDWVISDRFTDASFAYQGGGRKLARGKLEALEQWVHPHLQPDLTLLFDVPLEVARARLDASRAPDKFEQERADFFAATRTEYLRRAAEFAGSLPGDRCYASRLPKFGKNLRISRKHLNINNISNNYILL